MERRWVVSGVLRGLFVPQLTRRDGEGGRGGGVVRVWVGWSVDFVDLMGWVDRWMDRSTHPINHP